MARVKITDTQDQLGGMRLFSADQWQSMTVLVQGPIEIEIESHKSPITEPRRVQREAITQSIIRRMRADMGLES